jgi:hypothetical protein
MTTKATMLVLALLVLGGCMTGPSWVTRAGGPIDPLAELRCDEYSGMNRPGFTGMEVPNFNKCMRAYGYVRPSEVGK